MKRFLTLLLGATVALCLTGHLVIAQTITGAITGTVTDATGAPAPNVKVTATNTGTNVAFTAQTNDSGVYNLLFLPVGEYNVTAESAGFKKTVLGPFRLEVNQTARVDMQLQVGQVTETLEVTDVAAALQTESASTGARIDSQKLTEIPLNGRNFVSLTFLIPGAVVTSPGTANTADRFGGGGRPIVNGNRQETNNFLLDGIDINDSIDNRIGYRPSVDAIQEVQVITSVGSAEFGNSAGSVINMTIKSGTNEFHGSAFEFLRNSKLDANGFFRNRQTNTATRRAFKQNIFGGTLGGPIIRNKAFFFVNYEGTRRRDEGPGTATVLPAEMRSGNLSRISTPIIDPTTRLQFPGNIIPQSRIVNPVAQALFSNPQLYPLPNQPGTGNLGITNNFGASSGGFLNSNQGDVKIDWRPSDRDNIAGRYSQTSYELGSSAIVLPAQLGSLQEGPMRGASLSWARTISPTIVNEVRVGFTRNTIIDLPLDVAGIYGLDGNAKLGIAGPQVLAGASAVNFGTTEAFSAVGSNGIISDGKDTKITFSDNLTFQFGRHLLKVGANGVRYRQNRFYAGNNGALGFFGYTGDITGSSTADFLLNQLRNKGRGQADGRLWGHRHWRFGTFIQDDFKLTPRLTLNLGLRWEYTQPVYEVNDLQSNFDLQNGALLLAGQNGNSRSLINPYYKQFMPRVGFAWTANERLVVRGGYGITSFLEGTGANLRLPLNPPNFFESNVNYDTTAPGDIRVGFTDLPPFSGQIAGNVRIWDPDLRPQFTQQVNFTLEYLLGKDLTVTGGYMMQRATHTVVARDSNQPLPGVGTPSATNVWAPLQQRRPLFRFQPGITTTATTESSGTMDYDALQVSARKRLSQGLDFLASYTFSKTFQDALGFYGAPDTRSEGAYWQNAYDRNGNRGFAPWDARHNFNIGGNFELPFGRGRRFGADAPKGVDLLLGGWSVGYVMSARSGFGLTVAGFDRSQQGPRGTQRPDRLRELDTTGSNVDAFFGRTSATLCTPGTDNGVCAYQDPAAGTFGNSAIGTERGPRFFNFDMSVGKRFTITERQNLAFRAEFFNMPNSVAWGPPVTNIQNPATFGQITTQLNNPRNIQLGLKYNF